MTDADLHDPDRRVMVATYEHYLTAQWGAVFGAVAHALTGGKRDFQSISSLVAARYLVRVTPEHADAVRQLLAQLTPALQK